MQPPGEEKSMTKNSTTKDMKKGSTMGTGKAKANTASTKQQNIASTMIERTTAAVQKHQGKFAYSGKATFAKLVTPDNPYPVDLLKYAISQR